ncbi:MAG TPA: hypothetical protein VFQ61_08545 [Polyangiaceae bacterium]|nr:hypothetical protein [Polyangiaceae bacterium]
MSESNNIVLFPLPHGVEHDVPADDRRSEEQELQQILRRLTTDMSALAKVKALPRAKVLYESLHPETRHGGDRITAKQVSNSRTWSTFTKHVADTCGISQSTV